MGISDQVKHKAIIYLRISTVDQSTYSLETQEEACRKLVKSREFELVDVITDDGYSGDSLNRPGIQKVLAMARRKEFDRFIVWKLDRFSRRTKDVCTILEDEFEPRGIKFISEQEPYMNTDTPFGTFIIQILSTIAQLERANTLEKTKIGQLKHLELGRYLGQAPYGYKVIKESQQLEIVPEEAKIVKKIFSWYTKENLTTRQITKELNQQLIHGPIRIEWNWNTIDHMLKNEIYTGERTQKRKGDEKKEMPDTLHKFTCTPIITKELFILAQQKRKQHKTTATHNLKRDYLFRGIIHCGNCGKVLNPKPKKDKGEEYYSYTFRNRTKSPNRCETKCGSISEMKVARAISHYFFKLVASKNLKQIEGWLIGGDISKNKEEDAIKEIESLEVQEEELRVQYDKITEGYEEGRMDKNRRNARYTSVENRLASIKDKILTNEQFLLSEKDKANRRIAFKDLAGKVQHRYALDVKGVYKMKEYADESIRETIGDMVSEGQLSEIYVIWEKNALHVHFPVIDEDTKGTGGRLVLMNS